MRVFIIGMKKVTKVDKSVIAVFKLLMEYKTFNAETKKLESEYKSIAVEERILVGELNCKKYDLINANIQSDKVVAKSGSLDRFMNGINDPFVILDEIRNEDNKLLGYRLANIAGRVTKLGLNDTLKYCADINKRGGIPIQNAMYVAEQAGKSAFIRAYPNNEFHIEYMRTAQNKYSKPASINKTEADKLIKKNRLEDLFSKEQIEELKKAKAADIDIRIIGNNKLSAEQMKIIWETEQKGLKGRLFADPDYSIENMNFYAAELECKSDINQLLNPKYSLEQIFEISLGIELGIDVSKYANPKTSAVKMAEIRHELQSKVWKNYEVHFGSLSDLR